MEIFKKYNNFINEKKLFTFINPKSNDKLTNLTDDDLQEFLNLLDSYYLKLRKSLGFSEYVTFGLEIEFEYAMTERIKKVLEEENLINKLWYLKSDSSLKKGAEISSPVLTDSNYNWQTLKKVCNIVKERAQIYENSSGHIHIGTQVLGNNTSSWLNFLKLWAVYENIIFRFLYGEFLTSRLNICHYANVVSNKFYNTYLKFINSNPRNVNDIINDISHNKFQAVNFLNVTNPEKYYYNNTIEFRSPNGTLNPIIWQNNVNLLLHILTYSKNSNFDDDTIRNRYRSIESNDFYNYKNIYLKQALELADLIFDNNFDKIYFLRQYLKSFEIGKRDMQLAKKFTM